MNDFDLSFVDVFNKSGSVVRPITIQRINDAVMSVASDLRDYHDECSYKADIPEDNDRILAMEGYTRKDMESGRLPAYMSDRVRDESGLENRDFMGEYRQAQQEVFDAVYRVDAVLSDGTRQSLGADYAAFVKQREQANQARRAKADALTPRMEGRNDPDYMIPDETYES